MKRCAEKMSSRDGGGGELRWRVEIIEILNKMVRRAKRNNHDAGRCPGPTRDGAWLVPLKHGRMGAVSHG